MTAEELYGHKNCGDKLLWCKNWIGLKNGGNGVRGFPQIVMISYLGGT